MWRVDSATAIHKQFPRTSSGPVVAPRSTFPRRVCAQLRSESSAGSRFMSSTDRELLMRVISPRSKHHAQIGLYPPFRHYRCDHGRSDASALPPLAKLRRQLRQSTSFGFLGGSPLAACDPRDAGVSPTSTYASSLIQGCIRSAYSASSLSASGHLRPVTLQSVKLAETGGSVNRHGKSMVSMPT